MNPWSVVGGLLVLGAVLAPVWAWRERSVRRVGDAAQADQLRRANVITAVGYCVLVGVALVWAIAATVT